MVLSWDYDLENFDGFWLYRDNELIVIFDIISWIYYDYYVNFGQIFIYELIVFRKVVEFNDIFEFNFVDFGLFLIFGLLLV